MPHHNDPNLKANSKSFEVAQSPRPEMPSEYKNS